MLNGLKKLRSVRNESKQGNIEISKFPMKWLFNRQGKFPIRSDQSRMESRVIDQKIFQHYTKEMQHKWMT